MLNCIIFSKDRACQLELLLTSMGRFWREFKDTRVQVIYTYSSLAFRAGYSKLMRDDRFANVVWHRERRFKFDLIRCVDYCQPMTVFFCDDDVMVRTVSTDAVQLRPDDLCVSLRLQPGLRYCLPGRCANDQPVRDAAGRYLWRGLMGDYGYPMSLDGHIYRTSDLLPLLINLDYQNPNTLEYAMSLHPPDRPYMVCRDEAAVFSLCINQVQTEWLLPCGDVSAAWLNREYLEGRCIDLAPYIDRTVEACHEILPVEMTQQREP